MTSNIQVFDEGTDIRKALLWQYEGAEKLKSLIESKQLWYDQNHTQFWEDWRQNVFSLKTANNFGMSVWAKILDVPLVFIAPPDEGKKAFGFGAHRRNFTHGNFKSASPSSVKLTLDQKRVVLQLRYFQLTTNGSILDINRMLKYLFTDDSDFGSVYVQDNYDMTITYIFGFTPSSQLQLVLDEFDLLPRPCGVSVDYTFP